jgi:hypothetical protein
MSIETLAPGFWRLSGTDAGLDFWMLKWIDSSSFNAQFRGSSSAEHFLFGEKPIGMLNIEAIRYE